MGFWTWTDARRVPRLNKWGDYASADKVGYGGYAKVVCPDNTEIIEQSYEGYGIFDDQDVYELVVDWNKKFLTDLFAEKENVGDTWGMELRSAAECFQNDDADGLAREIEKLATEQPLYRTDWKRIIGIAIACEDSNSKLPYPIKITTKKWHCRYNELVPSKYCQ